MAFKPGIERDEFQASAETLHGAWRSLEKQQFDMPWEREGWSAVFSDSVSGTSLPSQLFPRQALPPVEDNDSGEAEVPHAAKQAKRSFTQVVKVRDDLSWLEEREAKWQTAFRRWHRLVSSWPNCIGAAEALQNCQSLTEQYEVLGDYLKAKSPATLEKRATSIANYCSYLDKRGDPFPGDEQTLYAYLCAERTAGKAPSRMKGTMEALTFVQFVLQVDVADLISSRRCHGVGSVESSGPKAQASPFTLVELRALHRTLRECGARDWNALMAGTLLYAIYSRSRWSDMQHATNMIFDKDAEGRVCYVECRIEVFKSRAAAAFKGQFLPAIAPAKGITEDNWGEQWMRLRDNMGLTVSKQSPVMPAPNCDGTATKRAIDTEECKRWILLLLEGLNLEGRRLTSHSCKCTVLSYLSKHGDNWEDRLILGGHAGQYAMAINYSRDAMARPLRVLEALLLDIRESRFNPDETRSGRFSKSAASILVKDESENEDAIEVITEAPEPVEAGHVTTSSGSCEAGEDEKGPGLVVRDFTPPDGFNLVQHSKLKTLHLQQGGHVKMLQCGRRCGPFHTSEVSVRYDTPKCSVCWKST